MYVNSLPNPLLRFFPSEVMALDTCLKIGGEQRGRDRDPPLGSFQDQILARNGALVVRRGRLSFLRVHNVS